MSLLELLDAPGIHSTAQLAAELGTTPEMVEAKLERYAQLGYRVFRGNMSHTKGGESNGESCRKGRCPNSRTAESFACLRLCPRFHRKGCYVAFIVRSSQLLQ